MKDFSGRTAVITGGASGIGLASAEALGAEGARIVVADVEATALDAAVARLAGQGVEAIGIQTDVSDPDSVDALAEEAEKRMGPIHILLNNAGVGPQEDVPVWEIPLNDWRWTFQVNVWGVIHGIRSFVPKMLAHGESSHIVNTSSGNGGLMVLPTTPVYATSKSAVSAVTEALYFQLAQMNSPIRVSVLYPGPHIVATNIFSARRNRPEELAREFPQSGPEMTLELIQQLAEGAGMDLPTTSPEEVAGHLMEGLRGDKYYILPASEAGDARVRERTEGVLARANPVPPKLF